MKFLTGTLARSLYALPMVVFGIMHFMYAGNMEQIVPAFFPIRLILVYVTGAALILAGISIVTKIQTRLASLLLALLLLIFIATMHIPGLFNEQTMQMSMTSMLKDIGLMAAALLIAGMSKKE